MRESYNFDFEEEEEVVISEETRKKPVKAAFCPLCKGWMRVGTMPEAELNPDITRLFRQALREGYEIAIQPYGEFLEREQCTCGGPPDVKPKRKPKS